MFALPIFMPRFKSINFYQNSPKTKLHLQNIRALEARRPDIRTSGGWGLRSQTPKTAPPIANNWLRA